ncbi:MAG: electron transfer flavoprotein-ubiquinone oxidoreductase [Bacteroidetes bacterium]|nr:electron transfer flavoprotein-ubiquinone oxidoreductase [Bacteroidota bacterium]MCL2301766.1 electron transfer flavoprotein-ubiquinone oxidoreductase [Lentimicrobiaceae bacterium]
MIDENIVYTDVLIIGAGPAGLSTAIHLADLLKKKGERQRILVIEKGSAVGAHILSGAVVRSGIFKELLPEVNFEDIPFDSPVKKDGLLFLLGKSMAIKSPLHPPYMSNKRAYIASLGLLCQFLASIAEEKGVEIYPGFAVNEVLYNSEGKIYGAKTIDTGINHHGEKMENFQVGTRIEAKLTIFAEGVKGSLTQTVIDKFDLQKGKNPQIYSLGCKEVWEIPSSRIKQGEVYHTMGYPLNFREFGGGFIYGLKNNRVAVGLVVGLDTADPTFDVYSAFQVWKTHPAIAKILKGGKMIAFGAKTLPEGGYYSFPKPFVDNALIVGDGAGFVAMPALKGIHHAIKSGMLAAETALVAFSKNDFSEQTLQIYQEKIDASSIYKEFYPVRNFRQAFAKGLIKGAFHFGTQLITGGAGFAGKLKVHSDAEATKKMKDFKGKRFKERFKNKLEFDKELTFDKMTAVFYSGTHHDENQVCHLKVNNLNTFQSINIEQYDAPCQYFCPADVYEIHTEHDGTKKLRIHFENCVHCKTCSIKAVGDGITWNVPNGDNGPEYENM